MNDSLNADPKLIDQNHSSSFGGWTMAPQKRSLLRYKDKTNKQKKKTKNKNKWKSTISSFKVKELSSGQFWSSHFRYNSAYWPLIWGVPWKGLWTIVRLTNIEQNRTGCGHHDFPLSQVDFLCWWLGVIWQQLSEIGGRHRTRWLLLY